MFIYLVVITTNDGGRRVLTASAVDANGSQVTVSTVAGTTIFTTAPDGSTFDTIGTGVALSYDVSTVDTLAITPSLSRPVVPKPPVVAPPVIQPPRI